MISAASHHFSLPAIAFKITSCAFIIRSISAAGICCSMASTPFSFSHPRFKRTFHLLIEADNSHATDTAFVQVGNETPLRDMLPPCRLADRKGVLVTPSVGRC